ncbi:MAG: hypothetical protein OXT69_15085 [Candidatus Poribacteria bacterium]|nr:hypothetical protein [Candidatus Poribacteria bacterium]
MKNERRRKARGVFVRALRIVLAAGAVLAYWYSVHLALDLKAKIDADEPRGEWFVRDKNENRPRYIGPQNADALLSALRFDMGEEKSDAQTAELKAHFERVLERGAVFQDNMDMFHFGPALMRRFREAAEYERQRVAEHSEDADFPSIRALYDLPESASWTELENALMDGDLKKWKDAKKGLDSIVNHRIKAEKESTSGTLRETLRTTLPFALMFVLLGSWGLTRPFIRSAKSNSRGIRLIQDKGKAKLAVVFLLIWCACGSSAFMLNGPSSALNWGDDYTKTKSFLREAQEKKRTARELLYRIRAGNERGYSDFDDLATATEIQRHRGKKIATSMLFSAAILPISFGMVAWLIIRWRAALQANADALTEHDE